MKELILNWNKLNIDEKQKTIKAINKIFEGEKYHKDGKVQERIENK